MMMKSSSTISIIIILVITMVVGCLGRMDVANVFMLNNNNNPTPNRCYIPTEYCALVEGKRCCEGLYCEGFGFSGTCTPVSQCISQVGAECHSGDPNYNPPCCYPNICHHETFWHVVGHCVPRNLISE
ncbi:hypothetical protein CsatA_003088 [Cannabis sativa]